MPDWMATALQVVLGIIVPLFWLALLWWSVRREPRRLRNGFLLIFAVMAAVGLLGDAVGLLDIGRALNDGFSQAWILLLIIGAAGLPFALIANGITMVRRESRSLGNMLTLLAGIAILVAPALLLLPVVVHYSWVTLGLVTLIGSLALTAGYLFLGFLAYTLLYAQVAKRATGNAVIVLGAQVIGTRVPPLLAGRLTAGVEAAERADPTDPVPLVVSGGRGADETVAEGEAMAAWLRRHDVAPERIVIEAKAATTEENLRFSRSLLVARGVQPPYLVATSNYHAPRAALLARDLGLDAQVVGGRTAWYFLPSAYLREFIAVLRSRARWVAVACLPALLLTAAVVLVGLTR